MSNNRKRHHYKRNGKREKKKYFPVIIILLVLLIVCIIFLVKNILSFEKNSGTKDTSAVFDSAENESTEKSPEQIKQDKLAAMIDDMSLEQKVAQLFFVTPEELTGVGTVLQAGQTTQDSLSKIPVGGVIYFSQNIESEDQLRTMISNTQSYSEIPLFVGVDEEGGSLVARIANSGVISVTKFPDMAEIGAAGDASQAYTVGTTIGSYLKDLGFNLDFAPDSDVLVNPDNTAIGTRSFGSDASVVSQMVAQEVKGLQEQEVSAALKHFPGHGSTTEDSHNGSAVVNRSLEELQATEFLPFSAGIAEGADFVMVGHLEVPQVTGDETPATMSSKIVTDLLRNQLGFEKIVVTDSMSMGAITEYYSQGDAAVQAIAAGCDMILMPQDLNAAYQGVIDAVKNGTLSEARIEESLQRILSVKYDRFLQSNE